MKFRQRMTLEEWQKAAEEEQNFWNRVESHKDAVRRCFHCLLRMVYDPLLDAWDCVNCGWRAVDEYFAERDSTRGPA